jgi:hypothetical protein
MFHVHVQNKGYLMYTVDQLIYVYTCENIKSLANVCHYCHVAETCRSL